jgi:hypothetical protein
LSWSFGNEQDKNGVYSINNTFVNNFVAGSYGAIGIYPHDDTAYSLSKNDLYIDLQVGVHAMSNIDTDETTTLWVTSDPGLTDLSGYDYTLKQTASEAINNGTWQDLYSGRFVNPAYQYNDQDRDVSGGTIDIGAYEYDENDSDIFTSSGVTIQ